MSQTIDLRTAVGGVEYTLPLTISETNNKDISADTIQLSLGTYPAPGVWQAPDRDPAQAVKSQRVVQLLIGGTLKPAVAGTYYLWSRVLDSPEVVPRRQQPIVILV